MGMAASQARLLSITARIHDVEYQAQSIQNAKVQLATQSDQVYQEYLEALDATTLTVKDYEGNVITANFNNLCGMNAVDTRYQYALHNDKNQLIVSEEIEEGYYSYKEAGNDMRDPYAFALYMLGGANNTDLDKLDEDLEEVYEELVNNSDESQKSSVQTLESLRESMSEKLSKAENNDYNKLSEEEKKEYEALEKQFKHLLYSNYGDRVFNKNTGYNTNEESGFDQDAFNYYVNIFKQIQLSGGIVSIDSYDGENGDAASNSDWLKNMIECGKISISIVNSDKTTGELSYSTTSPSSDSYLGYTTTTSIDKSALAKAEAEYENETKKIDAKDKKFDMDLSKLETERTALTTEYDSVKKVISDNIERTFGIFS